MKRLLILTIVLMPFLAAAQVSTGEITYEETTRFTIDLPEEHREELKGMLPSERKTKKSLFFTAEASMYKDAENEDSEEEVEAGAGNVQIKMVMVRPDDQLYKNLSDEKKVDQRDFMGKKFLIKDALKTYAWKITGEQKTVLDYTCQQATYQDSNLNVIAWFAPQIPVSSGPDNFGGLPGMILEMDINEGERKFLATQVKTESPTAEKLQAPKKGKVVTQKEFEEIVAKKTKEMQEEMGGGNRTIHVIRRN